MKIEGGFAVLVVAEKLALPGVDEKLTTDFFFVQCDGKTHFEMPLSLFFHESENPANALSYAEDVLNVLRRAKEIEPYVSKMLIQK